jgi:hypothetical protein
MVLEPDLGVASPRATVDVVVGAFVLVGWKPDGIR